MSVIDEIAAERKRQVETENFTAEHDDHNWSFHLSEAAACYAGHAARVLKGKQTTAIPALWPWADEWWKPTTPRRDLIKAAALIVAEIERLDRASGSHQSDCAICNAPAMEAGPCDCSKRTKA